MRTLERARRYGLAAAAGHLGWRALYRVAGYVPYACLALTAEPRVEPPEAGVVCRQVAFEELEALAGDPAYELGERALRVARERGDFCVGVFAAGRLLSYCFNARAPTQVDTELRFRFPTGWLYHYKALTLPDWRGRRLHGLQIGVVRRAFAASPIVTLVTSINHASLASFRRLGFTRLCTFSVAGDPLRRRLVSLPWDATRLEDGGRRLVFSPDDRRSFAMERTERALCP